MKTNRPGMFPSRSTTSATSAPERCWGTLPPVVDDHPARAVPVPWGGHQIHDSCWLSPPCAVIACDGDVPVAAAVVVVAPAPNGTGRPGRGPRSARSAFGRGSDIEFQGRVHPRRRAHANDGAQPSGKHRARAAPGAGRFRPSETPGVSACPRRAPVGRRLIAQIGQEYQAGDDGQHPYDDGQDAQGS